MKVNRVYRYSDEFSGKLVSYDTKKKPSWVRFESDINIQFLRADHEGIQYWFRRYFQDYFLILNAAPSDYASYYDEIANTYNAMVPQNNEIADFIIKKMHDHISKNAHILELSAGTGILSKKIVPEWSNLTITDISPKCLEIAKRETHLSDKNIIVADILKFSAKKKFDAIVELMGLDYFSDDEMEKIALNVLSKLHKNGIAIFVDRHHYTSFEKRLNVLEKGFFDIETPTGTFPYAYMIATKK